MASKETSGARKAQAKRLARTKLIKNLEKYKLRFTIK
jgi:hypothetical protein